MSTLKLRLLNTRADGFAADFERLLDRAHAIDPKIETTVRDIVADVRARGDAAVVEYTRRFDRREVASVAELEVSRSRLREVSRAVTKEQYEALANAAERIRRLPRTSAHRFLDLHRTRRHAARSAGDGARPRRAVRTRRQGRLSVVGAHERDTGQGRRACRNSSWWCRRRTEQLSELVLAAALHRRSGSGVHASAARRRSRRSLTARRRFPRSTRSSVREMCMSPPPSARVRRRWTST